MVAFVVGHLCSAGPVRSVTFSGTVILLESLGPTCLLKSWSQTFPDLLVFAPIFESPNHFLFFGHVPFSENPGLAVIIVINWLFDFDLI